SSHCLPLSTTTSSGWSQSQAGDNLYNVAVGKWRSPAATIKRSSLHAPRELADSRCLPSGSSFVSSQSRFLVTVEKSESRCARCRRTGCCRMGSAPPHFRTSWLLLRLLQNEDSK